MITTNETDIPIAIWKKNNGKDKKIIYIDKNPNIELCDEEKFTEKEIKDGMIMYKMNKKFSNENSYDAEKYKKIIKKISDSYSKNKFLEAYNGKFEFIPSFQSERIYICGPSECGKSYQVARYIEKYKKYHPKNKVYLISDTNDKNDEINKYTQSIPLEFINNSIRKLKKYEKRIENPITPEDFQDSLVIFDDVDSITDKETYKSVLSLNDQIFKKGRHHNTSIIRTNHKCTENGGDTIYSLNNSQVIIVYPMAGNHAAIKNVIRTYFGVNNEVGNDIVSMNTRWVAIRKSSPLTMISENLIKIL